MKAEKYKIHPVAAMFPLMEERSIAFGKLLASIENLGQQDAIVVDRDTLIDGRHRLLACERLGIEPKIVEWKTLGFESSCDSIGEWIMLKNLERRHLTPEQRVQIASKVEGWILNQMNAKRRGDTQFQPGTSPNPNGRAGKLKEQVRTDSYEPVRDHKKENANSTAGQLAAKAGTTIHKARQALKIQKAVDAGDIPKEDLDAVIAGTAKPVEVLKKIESKNDVSAKPIEQRVESDFKGLLKKYPREQHAEVKSIISHLITQ
jgi:hypothetical protein